MDVNGVWIGYGLGDVSITVQAMKQYLLKMFASYAGPLQASLVAGGTAAQTYDQTMVDVVTEMQTRYGDNSAVNPDLVINGIMSFSWQIRCGFQKPPTITIVTAQGSATDMFDTSAPQPFGGAQFVAAKVPNVRIQAVGYYPAEIYPMGASIGTMVAATIAILGGAPPITPGDAVWPTGPVILWGYSQSAVGFARLWRDSILNPAGALNNRLNDIIAAVMIGPPMRCPGIANGNADCGWPMPGLRDGQVTGGIAGPDDLTPDETPFWWFDYVNMGTDEGKTALYENAPVGSSPWTADTALDGDLSTDNEPSVGADETLIYQMIVVENFGGTLEGLIVMIQAAAEQFSNPIELVVDAAEGIWNGLLFAVDGPAADHYTYDWQPQIDHVTAVCEAWNEAYITSGGVITSPPVLAA